MAKSRELVKVVGAILVDPVGLILLQQRDDSVQDYPLMWTLFGGRVESHETESEALWRELYEEIEITRQHINSWWLFETNVNQSQTLHQTIYIVHITAQLTDLTLREGKSMDFFRPDEILQLDLAFNFDDVFSRYLKIA